MRWFKLEWKWFANISNTFATKRLFHRFWSRQFSYSFCIGYTNTCSTSHQTFLQVRCDGCAILIEMPNNVCLCHKGPPRIPVFGSYLFLLMVNYSQIHKAISTLSKYYKTNVLGFYLGDTPTIVAKDTASVKEILLNQSFDGRSDMLITQVRDPERSPRGLKNSCFFI